MNAWFEFAQKRFEVFLEQKMELYYVAAAPISEALSALEAIQCKGGEVPIGTASSSSSSAGLLGNNLRSLPTEFLDDVHSRMEHAYHRLDDGYQLTTGDECVKMTTDGKEEESTAVTDNKGMFLYGELLPAGVRALLSLQPVKAALIHRNLGRRPAFIDLGSGTGKIVFEAVQLLNTNDKSCCSNTTTSMVDCVGIELAKERHSIAMQAALEIPMAFRECLHVYCGSMFDSPLPLEETVTVAFACALGFGDAHTRQLLDLLWNLYRKHGVLECAVLLIRSIPLDHPVFCSPQLVTIDQTMLQTSWMDEAPALVICFAPAAGPPSAVATTASQQQSKSERERLAAELA